MSKLRVAYLLHEYPQLSETYIKSEIEAVADECELLILSLNQADTPYARHLPFRRVTDGEQARRACDEFRPDVLHMHWLYGARMLGHLAGFFTEPGRAGREIPFTVRTHSFDILQAGGEYVPEAVPILNSDLCLGVLAFPFCRPLLEKAGVRGDKLRDCYPVVRYRRFLDRSPNGDAVMNMGAALPKKKMEDFLELGARLPQTEFNLYAMGYNVTELDRLNAKRGNPVRIMPPVEPEDMPREYKKHRWLVYTASREFASVGWSIAVAEAQASGVGVCMPNLRPDLKEYVGEAGYLYDSIDEVVDIISKPFPEEKRQLAFEHARRSDIDEHKTILTDLWHGAVSARAGRARSRPHDADTTPWGEGGSKWEWEERVRRSGREVAELVPPGGSFILADEGQFGPGFATGRTALPFLGKDGQYWGAPPDDATAIEEVERLRQSGADYMVFAWPARWWLDYYTGLHHRLRSRSRCILENERLVVFDLRGDAADRQPPASAS